ncbi:MAG: serine hydrolase domain-containing protein [Gemmatimonadaceae bacterium]
MNFPALLLIALAAPPTPLAAQRQQRDTLLSARIARVEQGLLPGVFSISGTPDSGYAITDRMRYHHVPGVSIAVVDRGKIAWARGYGVREFGAMIPVDTSTLFQAGSISKPVAAMGALALVEKGKLELDRPVNSVLVSWKVPENEFTKKKPVTLRGILTHSAGLTVHGFPGYAAGSDVPTLMQVLDGTKPANTAPVRVDILPGSQWRYSGGGISIMQLLMTDVTGRPFPDLMRELVLSPIGMRHSTFENPLPWTHAARTASGHERADTPVPGKYHTYPEMAAAGLWTTPSDLARWIIEVQRSYKGESSRVLSQAMTRQMLTRQFDNWGLGVSLGASGDSATFSHGGRDEGFVAQLLAFTERGQGVVVMTNSVSGPLISEIMRSVAREYRWPERRRTVKTIVKLQPDSYQQLEGRYRFAIDRDTFTVTISSGPDRLFIDVPGQSREELLPESDVAFFSLGGLQATFTRAQDGSPGELVIKQGGRGFKGKRWD